MAVAVAAALLACGGPEEKKAKFYDRAREFFAKGETVKARLEVKNALQVDPKFAEGYELLGQVDQREGNLKGAFDAFSRAAELKPELALSQVELGKLLLMSGAADKALERAEAVLAGDPGNVEALILEGSVLLVRKDTAGAIAIFEGLLKKGVKKPEVYLVLASAHTRAQDSTRTEKVLKEGIGANPGAVSLHLVLSRLYAESNRLEKAEDELRKVIELEPNRPAHKLALAGLYWEMGRQAAAIDLIAAMVAADAGGEDTLEKAARFYMAKRQPFEAAKVLEGGLQKAPQSFRLRVLLGDVYLNLNRPPKAMETLEAGLKTLSDPQSPGAIQIKNALARIHLMLRQTEKAEAYVNEVLQANPKSVEGHFMKGDIHLIKGEGGPAVAEFQTVVSDRPHYIPGYLRLASAHVLNKEMDLALASLQNALKTDPKSKETMQALARIFTLKKDFTAAEDHLRRVVELDPGDDEARADLGDFLTAFKKYPEAEAAFRAITQRAPQSPLGYLKLARFFRVQGKDKEALQELEEGYRRNQTSAQLLTELIQTYVRQNKHAAAAAVCKKRMDDNPRDVFATNLLGLVFTESKNYPEAENALKKAIEMQPLWSVSHNSLAKLYLVQGRKREAIDKFNAAIAANPKDPAAYLSLAVLLERDRDFAGAITIYQRALNENPGFWFAANNLALLIGETATRREDLMRAKQLAENALKQRPGEAAILDTLGWVHFRLGDLGQARGLIEQALVAAPESDVLNYHLGAVLLGQGQKDEARARLQKALDGEDDFPGRDEAQKKLKDLG
jgi:tetratricopeptide (TPR) repeat protein